MPYSCRRLWVLCLCAVLTVTTAWAQAPRAALAAAAPAATAPLEPDLAALLNAARGDSLPDRLAALLKLRDLGPAAAPLTLELAQLLWQPEAEVMLLDLPSATVTQGELATAVLGAIGQPAVGPLTLALASDAPAVRGAAGRVLRSIDPDWRRLAAATDRTPVLVEWLASNRDDVRRAAAQALGLLAQPSAVPGLSALLADQNAGQDLRLAALRALTLTKDEAVPAALQAVAGDADPQIRKAVVSALGELRPAPADALLAATEDSDPQVRATALSALRYTKDPRVPAAAKRLLADPDAKVRAGAAIALGDLRDPSGLDALYGAIEDPARYVREEAIASIARIGDPAAAPRLIELTRRQGDPRQRELAARALARFPARPTYEALIALLSDEQLVSEAAAASLRSATKQELGLDQAAWQAWLAQQPSDAKP